MKHFDYQYFPTLTTLGNHRCRAEVPTHGRNKKGKMLNKSAILGRGYPPSPLSAAVQLLAGSADQAS